MKGHSERVPNKNFRLFAGEPLFYKIVVSLMGSKYVSKILIDTDSRKIEEQALKINKNGKIRIIQRPPELCGDFVSMNEIIKYDLTQAEDEHFLQTHSTNPLLTTKTIDAAIEKYLSVVKTDYDSLFSVTRWQTRLYNKDGMAINHNPDELVRAQDLAPVFEENSCLYIFSRQSFNKKETRIGKTPFLFEIDKYEAIDIDEEVDFLLAEQMFIIRETNKSRE